MSDSRIATDRMIAEFTPSEWLKFLRKICSDGHDDTRNLLREYGLEKIVTEAVEALSEPAKVSQYSFRDEMRNGLLTNAFYDANIVDMIRRQFGDVLADYIEVQRKILVSEKTPSVTIEYYLIASYAVFNEMISSGSVKEQNQLSFHSPKLNALLLQFQCSKILESLENPVDTGVSDVKLMVELLEAATTYHKMVTGLIERDSLHNLKSPAKKQHGEESTAYARRETIRLAREYIKSNPKPSTRSLLDFSNYARDCYNSEHGQTS